MSVCCIRNSRKLSLKKILFTNARLFFKLDFKVRLNSFRTGCVYEHWKEVNFILKNLGTRTLRMFCLDRQSSF